MQQIPKVDISVRLITFELESLLKIGARGRENLSCDSNATFT